jgi:soluble lytic murein transglycosylase-like protein
MRQEVMLGGLIGGALWWWSRRTRAAVGAAPAARWSPPPAAERWLVYFHRAERAYDLPRHLLARVAQEESNYNARARSPAGALGIMQLLPATAEQLGADPLRPEQAIPAAGRYLRRLFDTFGNWRAALAAYNWGPGNLSWSGYQAAPAETHRYVQAIAGDLGL